MKDMIYSEERKDELLYENTHCGIKFIVISRGLMPCAYLFLPKGHYLSGMQYEDVNAIIKSVHCGFTFSWKMLQGFPYEAEWILGWDYGHVGDKIGTIFSLPDDHAWTTQEIVKECVNVIDEINANSPKKKGVDLSKESISVIAGKTINGHYYSKIKSSDPKNDYLCKLRLFGVLKDVTRETIDRLKDVYLYYTYCDVCGSYFLTNSEKCKMCCSACNKVRNKETLRNYVRKYYAKNCKKIGYSMPWYKKHREEVLLKRKKAMLEKLGKGETFKCAVCGKTFNYLKDHIFATSCICKSPSCRKKYYTRKKDLTK